MIGDTFEVEDVVGGLGESGRRQERLAQTCIVNAVGNAGQVGRIKPQRAQLHKQGSDVAGKPSCGERWLERLRPW